jgi:hypothetical protein
MTNSIKQAAEFGIARGGQRLAAISAVITDVHAVGLADAQGLMSGIGGKAECARRVLKTSLMTRPDPAWWQQTKFRGRFC